MLPQVNLKTYMSHTDEQIIEVSDQNCQFVNQTNTVSQSNHSICESDTQYKSWQERYDDIKALIWQERYRQILNIAHQERDRQKASHDEFQNLHSDIVHDYSPVSSKFMTADEDRFSVQSISSSGSHGSHRHGNSDHYGRCDESLTEQVMSMGHIIDKVKEFEKMNPPPVKYSKQQSLGPPNSQRSFPIWAIQHPLVLADFDSVENVMAMQHNHHAAETEKTKKGAFHRQIQPVSHQWFDRNTCTTKAVIPGHDSHYILVIYVPVIVWIPLLLVRNFHSMSPSAGCS